MKVYRHTFSWLAVSFVTLLAAAAAATVTDTQWKSDLLQWRSQRAQQLSAPDGWLTLVGLEWLQPGKNTFGAAADNRIRLNAPVADHLGVLELKSDGVYLSAPAASLLANDAPARAIKSIPMARTQRCSKQARLPCSSSIVATASLSASKIRRRPRASTFRDCIGTLPIRIIAIEAKWIPFNPAHEESIPTIIGTTHQAPRPRCRRVHP